MTATKSICIILFIWLVSVTIWVSSINKKSSETAAITTQLEKCVTNLEKVHLIAKDGEIFHATLETTSTATNDHMPVLSE